MVMGKPTAREISMVFVRQYYTLLNEAPAQVHRFYSHDSSFVHGGIERDKLSECKPARGQKEINERIKKLCFTDARTKIRQVDAHPTLSDGVVIQVSGFMSNNGAPMRPFMQTFVLAPQSDLSYYVYNDIFRYQDELFSDDDEVGDAAVEADDEADMEEAHDPSTVSSTTASASAPAGGGDAVSTTDGSQQLHYQQAGMASSPGTAMKPQHSQRSAEVMEHHQNNVTQHGMLNGHSQAAVHAANAASGVVTQPQLSPQQPQQSAQHQQHNNIASTMQQPCAAVPTEAVAAHGAAGVLNCSGGSVDDADVVADAVLPADDAQDGNTDAAMMDDRTGGHEDVVTTTMTDAMVEAEDVSPAPAPSPPPPPPPVSTEPKTYANSLKGNRRMTAPQTRHVEKESSSSSRSASYAAAPAASTFPAGSGGGGGGGGSSSLHHHQQQGHHNQHQQAHYYQQQGQASYGTTAPTSGSSAHGGPPSGSYPSGGAHSGNNGGSFHNSSGGGGGSFESAGDAASAGPGNGPSMEPERRRINIHPDAHQIFVGNLPQDVEPEELIEHFQQYGTVVDVKIHSSKAQKMGLQTRNYPFYGFVAFESADVVQHVLNQMPTTMVRNGNEHRLNIEHKQSRPMDGGRMGGGRGGFSRGGGGMSRGLRGGYGRGGGSDRGGGRGGGFHHQGQPPARR